jgi:hypothetical protein
MSNAHTAEMTLRFLTMSRRDTCVMEMMSGVWSVALSPLHQWMMKKFGFKIRHRNDPHNALTRKETHMDRETYTISTDDGAGSPPPVYPANRKCRVRKCKTILSRFNPSDVCWCHQERKVRKEFLYD